MKLVLFDTPQRNLLYPFTATRPVADIRMGIYTIREFWEQYFQTISFTVTENYLQEKFTGTNANDVLLINAALIPGDDFFILLNELKNGEVIVEGNMVLAGKTSSFNNWQMEDITPGKFSVIKKPGNPAVFLQYPWQIFQMNGEALCSDFETITKNRISQTISSTNRVINPSNIFIEEGAKVEYSIINAGTGPVYIGTNCEVMESCMIRGPFAMLE